MRSNPPMAMMPAPRGGRCRPRAVPRRWARHLWDQAASTWLHRVGQDLVYRQHVVIPAVVDVLAPNDVPIHWIDLGCGDGRCARDLLESCSASPSRVDALTLVDWCPPFLEAARRAVSDFVPNTECVVADLSEARWWRRVRDVLARNEGRRVAFGIFLIQDLARLGPLFEGLAVLLRRGEQAVLVLVHPDYAEHLRLRGGIRVVERADALRTGEPVDWRWRGIYPIDVGGQVVNVPHFQRTLAQVRSELEARGFVVRAQRPLRVPDTPEMREVFRDTVYGVDIVGRDSSLLIVAERCAEEGRS